MPSIRRARPVESPVMHTQSIAALVLAALALGAAACSSSRPARQASLASSADAAASTDTSAGPLPAQPLAPGQIVRVGGDMNTRITERDGEFFVGPLSIDTPLPEGYPDPTPPGAMDIKTYPAVRRAEFRGTSTPESGMDRAFWPLFNHIKSRDIAMTSPVEMDYNDVQDADSAKSRDWTMSFLYRYQDQGPTGEDGAVVVRDAPPVTVLAMGVKGDYGMEKARPAMEQIEAWLAANPQWRAAGNWRSLYYNGPKLMWWNKWGEIQIPVERVSAAAR
ncbi:MAG: heme-binding protein [Planctomycetota bacterium]|nr:heme-binding protein [Planctomycetota bacterium]